MPSLRMESDGRLIPSFTASCHWVRVHFSTYSMGILLGHQLTSTGLYNRRNNLHPFLRAKRSCHIESISHLSTYQPPTNPLGGPPSAFVLPVLLPRTFDLASEGHRAAEESSSIYSLENADAKRRIEIPRSTNGMNHMNSKQFIMSGKVADYLMLFLSKHTCTPEVKRTILEGVSYRWTSSST